jgi:hypothetical protein
MSSLKALRTELIRRISDTDGMTPTSILDFIDDFIQAEDAKYQKNKQNRALSFGKFKGFTIKEVLAADKGKSYLEWLTQQQWFNSDKFPDLYDDIQTSGFKKK